MKRTVKRARAAGILFLIFCQLALFGCGTSPDLNDPQRMTPEQFSVYVLRVYNEEYALYQIEVEQPNLTEDKKKYLRAKKQVLTDIYNPMMSYTKYVQTGTIPPAELRVTLNGLLVKLAGLIGG